MASSNGVPTSKISSNSMSSAFDGMTHLPGTSVELAKEQYDSQSKEYKESKVAPWRTEVEMDTVARLLSLLGGVEGKSVIDLACGDGHYTRWLKEHQGASTVLGVDLSPGMIQLAEEQEQANPLGLKYICRDAGTLDQHAGVDIVFAAFLLNYASNEEELLKLVTTIYNILPKGGKFGTIQNSVHDVTCHHPELRKYGFEKTCEQPGVEGATIKYHFYQGSDLTCTIDNYFLSRSTYERVFRRAGFSNIGFVSFSVSDKGLNGYPEGYWDELLDARCIEGIFALKY